MVPGSFRGVAGGFPGFSRGLFAAVLCTGNHDCYVEALPERTSHVAAKYPNWDMGLRQEPSSTPFGVMGAAWVGGH